MKADYQSGSICKDSWEVICGSWGLFLPAGGGQMCHGASERKLDVLGYSDKSDTFWTCLGATLPQSLVCALLVGEGEETKPKESSSCCKNFCFCL